MESLKFLKRCLETKLFNFLVSILALSYLIYFDKIKLDLIKEFIKNPLLYFLGTFLIITQIIINVVRLRELTNAQTKQKVPFISLTLLTWISMFFNAIMPGAVSGDIVKISYLKKLNSNLSKSSLMMIIFLDRAFGLLGLLMIGGIASSLRYNYLLTLDMGISNIIFINLFLFLFGGGLILSLFFPMDWQEKIFKTLKKVPWLGEKAINLLRSFWIVGKKKKLVFRCMAFSVTGQILVISCFSIFAFPSIGSTEKVLDIITVLPIGLIITAIPIAPGSIGVGHIAFEKIFQMVSIENGANIFNIYFLTMLMLNILGVIPYLFYFKGSRDDKKQV